MTTSSKHRAARVKAQNYKTRLEIYYGMEGQKLHWPTRNPKLKAVFAKISPVKKGAPEGPRPPLPGRLMKSVVLLPQRTFSSAKRRLLRLNRSLRKLPHKIFVRHHWMKLGQLRHYAPQPLFVEAFPKLPVSTEQLPEIAIVTPSFQQAAYIGRTMESVLNQNYPRLCYVVQDGGSTDGTREILERNEHRVHAWACEKDNGQADAVVKGFAKTSGDIMAWLNSDDMLMPGALHYIGAYFARHPQVDVIYGHRVLIDEKDMEVGRWILPKHRNRDLNFVDYVPQETLFWRRSIYEKAGGVNPQYHFALDWDLILRFQHVGAKIVRLPYFIGCFRVHPTQKTSAQIGTRGVQEMNRILEREHGRLPERHEIEKIAHSVQLRGTMCANLMACGIRK